MPAIQFPSLARLVASVLLLSAAATASGQVVQLPTFHQFAVSTSVLVPDRGSALLGGAGRSAYSRTARGFPALGPLFGGVGRGGAASANGASVHVTIHDFDALDRATLAAAGARTNGQVAADPRAAALQRRIAARNADTPDERLLSVAETERRNARRDAQRQQEARQLFGQGQQAESQGHPGAAKIFYQMAARRADKKLQLQIAQRLEALRSRSR
jgi:hypothetical protein